MLNAIQPWNISNGKRHAIAASISALLHIAVVLIALAPLLLPTSKSISDVNSKQLVNVYLPPPPSPPQRTSPRNSVDDMGPTARTEVTRRAFMPKANASAVILTISPDTAHKMMRVLLRNGGSIGFAAPDSPQFVFAMFSGPDWTRATSDLMPIDIFFCVRITEPELWPEVRGLLLRNRIDFSAITYALFPPAFRARIDRQLAAASSNHGGAAILSAVVAFDSTPEGIRLQNIAFAR